MFYDYVFVLVFATSFSRCVVLKPMTLFCFRNENGPFCPRLFMTFVSITDSLSSLLFDDLFSALNFDE